MKTLLRILSIVGLLILIGGGIAVLVSAPLREAVARPVLFLIWYAEVMLRSFPQALFWGILLVAALLVAARSLSSSPKAKLPEGPAPVNPRGRVETLAFWVAEAPAGRYFKQRLARHLLDLLLQVRGYDKPPTARRLAEMLASGELGLPPEAQAYLGDTRRLLSGLDTESMARGGRLDALRRLVDRLLRPEQAMSPDLAVDPGLRSLIETLEENLEITHES
ncbi:MAG: hypothetical protein Kow00124_02380 [Anaerolineae bacterium]